MSQSNQSDERSEMDRKFSDHIEKLVHEIVSVPVEDFNLTTKLNRAASFQVIFDKRFQINPQAVGMDSGVQFSLSNFLEDILQPTSSKMTPTSNLGL